MILKTKKKIHRKAPSLESLFNKVAGLKTTIFQKALFREHLWMTAFAEFCISTKVLFIDHTFFVYFFIFSLYY